MGLAGEERRGEEHCCPHAGPSSLLQLLQEPVAAEKVLVSGAAGGTSQGKDTWDLQSPTYALWWLQKPPPQIN